MRTSWNIFGRALNHAARFAIAPAAAWPSRWSEPRRIKTTILAIQAHLCWHNATRTVQSLALPLKHTGMDGELVDVARRGVQADDQFHDSRRETREATMAKSPEKAYRRAVSLYSRSFYKEGIPRR